MASIYFRIKSELNKNVPIYVCFSSGRNTLITCKTEFVINPNDWSVKTKSPKKNNTENKAINSNLKKLEAYLYEHYNNDIGKGIDATTEWLKDKVITCFNRKTGKDINKLTNHIQYIIDNANTRKIKGSNKLGLSIARVKGYITFLGLINRYQKHIKKTIRFTDINNAFITKLINWLINEQKYAHSYAGKTIDNLKAVCTDASNMGIDVNSYASKIERFTTSKDERYIVTLDFKELSQIQNTILNRKALINARNWLLLGCEIGQRASDLLKLTKKDIRYVKGNVFVDVIQQKGKKHITAPVSNPYVKEILLNEFPTKISTQKLNEHLKEVCKQANLNALTKGLKKNKELKRKVLGTYPKHELISSHLCRRSFATNYYKIIPTPVLMEITAHSKESQFLEYINRSKDKDENANLFLKLLEQSNLNNEPQLKII